MKRAALGLLTGLAFIPAAFAADDDVMAGLYGNTFYVTDANGTVKYHYAPDHTYNEVRVGGRVVQGIWTITDGKLCETPKDEGPSCNPIRAHKAGDAWTGGGGKSLEIKAGLQ